jgi:tRNASer (uridine44-2'-O)-methyltransferase
MVFEPQEYPPSTDPILEDVSGETWSPIYWHQCSFSSKTFFEVMMNLIRNPNINSNHLFRADILMEAPYDPTAHAEPGRVLRITRFKSFILNTVMVRRLIPRNALVDKSLDQTCLLYTSTDNETKSLVVYLPHILSPSESPFYHPAVRGIAFLHTFRPTYSDGRVEIHYSYFASEPQSSSLIRTARHLLGTLHKHGQGLAAGYVKRVHHDTLLPQATVQDRYARLKAKYAKVLIASWVEVTDPVKHVFEDLGIAAFLIELWADLYPKKIDFPGFVDIGCGNGLLVYILTEEGYSGWGFDARKRKSWDAYALKGQLDLKELVLVPSMIQSSSRIETQSLGATNKTILGGELSAKNGISLKHSQDGEIKRITEHDETIQSPSRPEVHNGIFPKGTFIISNHADELTPWTPILATISESPFIMIPCCSHNLTGNRFRAPVQKTPAISSSSYASLVAWVSKLAEDCGWEVEKEMLRIPSTRNTALLGRRRTVNYAEIDLPEVLEKYGGAGGWEENAMKLVRGGSRAH